MTRKVDVGQVRVSAILGGDIRLEASTYLREGYGLVRLAEQVPGHVKLGDLADIWQPSRLTGYEVPEEKGLPFLTAGQTFEDFPRVRKWLARPFVPQVERRYVEPGWLLLSCSGVVGRVTAVYPHHLGKIITHDLLRIAPNDPADYGWLYAYMKTGFFQKVACAAQYGHMIKHIEVSHASGFPVIMPKDNARRDIGETALEAVRRRTRAWKLRDQAFALLEKELGADDSSRASVKKFGAVCMADVFAGRQRLDADYYEGDIAWIENLLSNHPKDSLGQLTSFASDLPRFSRVYGDDGTPYVSASELFDVNAKPTKFIYAKLIRGWQRYMLHAGTIIMACSGQKYGILGRALMLTKNHEGLFGSHDLLRIQVEPTKIPPAYLLTFLNDPLVGRTYVVRNAYGTSIPHLDPYDVQHLRIPRLEAEVEKAIADLMEESIRLSAEADRLEDKATDMAQEQIDVAISDVSAN